MNTGTMVKGIIGGNEVATEALIRGLTIHGPADAYYVSHCSDQLSSRLQAKCGVRTIKNIADLVPRCAILFLAFMPDEANTLLPKIAEKVKEWTLIVSSVHGLKLATLEYFFPKNEIVRLVYNPSIVSGAGLSAYAVSRNASTDAKSMAEIVLKECGDVLAVDSEEELEKTSDFLMANTYFSYVAMQSMIKNAKKIGMSTKEANFAVATLLKGSIHTLIDLGYDTSDIVSRMFNDKFSHDTAVELINDSGLQEDLMKELAQPAPVEQVDEADDPKNYKMHYRWSR